MRFIFKPRANKNNQAIAMRRQINIPMLNKKLAQKFIISLVATVGFTLFASLPAIAGFQWTPSPSSKAQEQDRPSPPSALSITTQPAVKAIQEPTPVPMPIEAIQKPSITPVTRVPIAPTPDLPKEISPTEPEIMPIAPVKKKMSKLIIQPYPDKHLAKAAKINYKQPTIPDVDGTQEKAKSDFFIIEGFGSDLPLALALRQIVPPKYGFAFGDNVNPGYRVSWTGGKPWNIVVQDMIAPLQLHLQVNESNISIKTIQHINKQKVITTKTATAAPPPIKITKPAPIKEEPKPTPLMHFSSKNQTNDEWKWDHGVIIKPMKVIKNSRTTPDNPFQRNNITDPGKEEPAQNNLHEVH